MLKSLLNKTTLSLGGVFVGATLLALIVGKAWPLLIFSAIVIVLYLPLPQKISSVISVRIILSIMLVLSLIQLEAVAGYAVKADMNPFVYGIVNAVFAVILATAWPNRARVQWRLEDTWTLLVPLLVVGGLIGSTYSLVADRSTDFNGAIIHKITTTSDESNHLNMFAQSVHAGGDMTITPKAYPTGWHVAMAVATASVIDVGDKPFMSTVVAYYVTKLVGVFLVVMSIMSLFVALSKQLLKKPAPYYLLFGLVTLFLCLAIVIPNNEINGFYNFTPQYAYFLMAFLLLLTAESSRRTVFLVLALFIVSCFTSWIISGILLFGMVVLALLAPWIARRHLKNRIVSAVLPIAAVVAIPVVALLVAWPSGVVGRVVDTLEHPEGWIEGYGLMTYAATFLLLIACGLFTAKSKLSLQFRAGLVTFFAVVAMVFLVTALRGYGGDHLSYYWQKMLFPLLLIAVVTLVVLAIQKIHAMNRHVVAVYAAIVIALVLSANSVLGYRPFDLSLRAIGNQPFLHKTQDLAINKPLKNLFENHQFGSEKAERYVFVTSSNFTLDQMVYQLMSRSITNNSMDVDPSCMPPILPNGGFYGDSIVLLKDIPSNYCGHEVKVVVSNQTIEAVKQYKNEADLINIDTDF